MSSLLILDWFVLMDFWLLRSQEIAHQVNLCDESLNSTWPHGQVYNVTIEKLLGVQSNSSPETRGKKEQKEPLKITNFEFAHWIQCTACFCVLRQKKKNVMLPSPDQNLKIGSVGRDFFFFFFFLRTVRELSFPIFFLKFLNGENSGGMQSKRIYKSCKCFFKPLNTNFSKFFAQIWHKKKKKKNDPVFSHFTVGRERAT